MFALKFKHWGFKENKLKYGFLISCIPLLFLGVVGIAVIIAWYVILSIATQHQ
jgi:CDP-diacylglycerol--serine O-phosphatidyltransferase